MVEPFKSNLSYFEQNTIALLPFVESRRWYLAKVDNNEKAITLYDLAYRPSKATHKSILGIIEQHDELGRKWFLVETHSFSAPKKCLRLRNVRHCKCNYDLQRTSRN